MQPDLKIILFLLNVEKNHVNSICVIYFVLKKIQDHIHLKMIL